MYDTCQDEYITSQLPMVPFDGDKDPTKRMNNKSTEDFGYTDMNGGAIETVSQYVDHTYESIDDYI